MKKKAIQFWSFFLSCAIVLSCAPAFAAEQFGAANVVWTADMEYEWVDPATVESWTGAIVPQATDSINCTVQKKTIGTPISNIALKSGDVVIFDCSYALATASVDYGVLCSDGKFYSLSGRSGKLDGSIGISYAGTYSIVIRNNSSKSITVVGTVTY